MYHNEIITNIIKFAKTNELKPNILYFFVIGHDPERTWCIEDKKMIMEEFSSFLSVNEMEKHVSSLLESSTIPFNTVKYTTNCNVNNKLIMPFSYQDINSIEASLIECFFAFEVM